MGYGSKALLPPSRLLLPLMIAPCRAPRGHAVVATREQEAAHGAPRYMEHGVAAFVLSLVKETKHRGVGRDRARAAGVRRPPGGEAPVCRLAR